MIATRHGLFRVIGPALAAALGGAWCCLGPGGCVGPDDRAAPANWNPSDPFTPVRMRIYPLTHVERGSSGPARLVCHFEFSDRWFDTTKAAGKLEIQLYRAGPGAGTEEQRVKWDIDLTNLDRNAEWFDPVTRTYRVQLDLPAWADEGPGSQFRLHATFTPTGAAQSTMRDDFVVKG